MLTTKQAATILNIDPRTIVKFIKRGLITAEKIGRDYIITSNEVERYQRERRQPGRPTSGK